MTIMQEHPEIKNTDQDNLENKMVIMVFNIPKKDARKLYDIASDKSTSASSIIRSILYGNTDNLNNFDDMPPDPYPSKKTGRPTKRFADE